MPAAKAGRRAVRKLGPGGPVVGICAAVDYRAIPTLTWFRKNLGRAPEDSPHALVFGRGALSLPCHTRLEPPQAETVADIVREFLEG